MSRVKYTRAMHDTAMHHFGRAMPNLQLKQPYDRSDLLVAVLYEAEAACSVPNDATHALDRSILFRSAATVALNADFPALALMLAHQGLSVKGAHREIHEELMEVAKKAKVQLDRNISKEG